jgi:hypothetical protein
MLILMIGVVGVVCLKVNLSFTDNWIFAGK